MFSILHGLYTGIAYSCLVTFIVLFTSSIYSESFKSEKLNFQTPFPHLNLQKVVISTIE